ncbi:hypothetical protein [Nitratifractor sp.]
MKELVERLARRGIVCRRLEPYPLFRLGSRRRIDLYLGVGTDGYYCTVVHIARKSRILRKDAQIFQDLRHAMEEKEGHRIPRAYTLIDAPLCSKAKTQLEEWGWKVIMGNG